MLADLCSSSSQQSLTMMIPELSLTCIDVFREGGRTHCGVLEFVAEEETIGIPPKVIFETRLL